MKPACFVLLSALLMNAVLAQAAEVPRSVGELWADFDPRRDALETEVIREWKEEGGGVQAGVLLHWQLQREVGTDGGDLWVSRGREGEGAGGCTILVADSGRLRAR